jgi:hypothetical protein
MIKRLIPLTVVEAIGKHCADCASANGREPASCPENGYCWLWPWRLGVPPDYDVMQLVWAEDEAD